MIYFLFEPLNIKKQTFKDIPLFDLKDFTLYELDTKGLLTQMTGDYSVKYSNRYEVSNMDYTDNSKEFIANMKANHGVYKDDIVDLKGDVVYTREDGLEFTTQKVHYNKKKAVATVKEDFIMYRDKDKIIGTSLIYDNLQRKATVTNVVAHYQLEEKTQ